MKKIYILLFALVAGICLSGCTREDDSAANGNIVIRLQVDGLETKSAGTSDENYVENLQLLIFKDINTAPDKVLDMTDMGLSAGVGPFEKEYATLSAFGGFTAAELNDATIFAVANYTGDLSSVANLATAKAKTVNADAFREGDGSVANPYAVKTSPRFVMTAETGIGGAFSMEGTKAVANLTLKRRVDKITLGISYEPIVTEGEVNFGGTVMKTQTTWTAMTDGNNIRIYLENAAANGLLDGFATDYGFFTYGQTYGTTDTGTGTFSYPFYSYPIDLAAVKGTDNEPFIKLIQPWKYVTTLESDPAVVVDENIVELYYKIMFPSSVAALLPNTWYKPTVHLKVLGGEASRPTAIVADEMLVAAFKEASSVGGDIGDVVITEASYLVPETHAITVNNGNTLQVQFFASESVSLSILSVKTGKYTAAGFVEVDRTSDADSWVTLTDVNADGIEGTEDDHKGTINLVHRLSADVEDASTFAMWPFVYTVKLTMGTGTNKKEETVTITQNPIVRVDSQLSSGAAYVLGNPYSTKTKVPIDLYTSPLAISSSSKLKYNDLGKFHSATGLPSGATGYRFIVRTAPTSSNIVCDPRVDVSDASEDETLYRIFNTHYVSDSDKGASGTPLGTSYNAAMLSYKPGTRRQLSSWTSELVPEVAPEFMVSSGYSTLGATINYIQAALRCATYQEDGYPAGRWRLPTEREIDFCNRMKNEGFMPGVFVAASSGYIASSGRRIDQYGNWNTTSRVEDSGYIRCVYDTWYWGTEEHSSCKNGSSYKWGGLQTSL